MNSKQKQRHNKDILDDVKKLAEYVHSNAIEWNARDCNGTDHYECVHCFKESKTLEDFKHELDCPALIAQDLLT